MRALILTAVLATALFTTALLTAADPPTPAATTQPAPTGLEALPLELPKPVFIGTPRNLVPGLRLDPAAPPAEQLRPPFFAPRGTRNVAPGKPVTASDEGPVIGEIKQITDGDKEGTDGAYVELAPGLQWVQIDLQQPCEIWAIVIWHFHREARVYRDVIIHVSDDPDFVTGVTPLFNNDHDNSAGLGVGGDFEYFETHQGKLIDAKRSTARYVRLYSKGSTADSQNHYTEVEVYARPAAMP